MGRSQRGSCFCTTFPRLTRHLQRRRNWPIFASNALITSIFSGSCPFGLPSFPWNEKQLKCSYFSSEEEVIAATENWLDGQPPEFLGGLQKLEERAKKYIELREDYVEQIPSLVSVASFLPRRAKVLSAPVVSTVG